MVHTAFLQPLHEPPLHYYNVTEYGLRLVPAFDIAAGVGSENFHPAHVIAWLASDLLRAVEAAHGVEARNRLAASSLDFWRSSWRTPRDVSIRSGTSCAASLRMTRCVTPPASSWTRKPGAAWNRPPREPVAPTISGCGGPGFFTPALTLQPQPG